MVLEIQHTIDYVSASVALLTALYKSEYYYYYYYYYFNK